MNVELASCPTPTETAVRRPFDWFRLLLVVNVLAVLTVAIGLRSWRLGSIPGLNGDEAWSGVQAMRLVGGQSPSQKSLAWQTPTGNPVNPFYLGPLAALHLFLAPSTTVLRIPALVSGLAALVVNFWLSRRVFGSTVAWVSTLFLAILPLNIAYSRFAWDASQSLLATILVLYLGLRLVPCANRPRALLMPPFLAYAATIWIHPTNVFAGWLLFVPLASCYRVELRDALARIRARQQARHGGLIAVLAFAGLILSAAIWRFRLLGLAVLARAVDPAQWGLFVRRLIRLFSGSTIFEFIAGPAADGPALDGLDLMFCCVAAAAGLGLAQTLRDPAAARQRCLALGSLATAVSFFIIAGPAAIAPHVERYGACLIAPGVVLMAVGLSYWLKPQVRFARPAIAALCTLAWLSLGTFGWRYFSSIQQTGGDSHLAFRTAAVEPKQAAWDYITEQSGGKPIVVVADSWWLYWPLAYLSAGHPEARVLHSDELTNELTAENRRQDSAAALWLVDFCESAADEPTHSRTAAGQRGGRTIVINDYSGRPLVSLVRAQPETAAD